MCVRSACCRPDVLSLADGAFSYSDVVLVVGWDSVVVEGWSSCFLVGVVLVVGQGGYFGECVLSPALLPGDVYRIVRQFRFHVEPPFEHFSLVLSTSATVVAG
ncbi:hypothetical protein CENDO_00920 [Corynebacterium endometrii]|uniref:Uncharacterized protein n=1 Tax=Corynebacterium endometrii TaxID=2488819 RepID=A0A4V1CEB1_9CORY|nr:hypothetical protein CENDO_00920 [Corynebacterium endometrii]